MPAIQTTVISASLTAPPASPGALCAVPEPSRSSAAAENARKRCSMIARRASRHNSSRNERLCSVSSRRPSSSSCVTRWRM